MLVQTITATLTLLSSTVAAETILGAYMFHRHGDRTSKSTPPTNLTDLGYMEVYTSGNWFRNRYVSSNATNPIWGMNTDIVKASQLTVTAPSDTVLQNSATGFLQGLYPPVGDALGSQTLRNGTNVTAPLNGYQLIPIGLVTAGASEESSSWLQASTGCAAATLSSNEYFSSNEYTNLLASTQDFYNGLSGVINATFNSSQTSYKNAYTIYDLVNVAEIHNATITDADLLTADNLFQLRTLADDHEWNLGYNASNNLRAIAGMTLAAEITQALNGTLSNSGKNKLNIQFGAYGSFGSFFGLAGLQFQNSDFYGIVDYASVMSFELVTNATVTSAADFPTTGDGVSVRFIFHNGTTSDDSVPVAYPLFNSSSTEMPWADFVTNMNGISVGSTEQWCNVCQNTTGACAAYATSSSNSSSSSTSDDGTSSGKSGNGLSPAVNGVIGAMVTLAVVLGVEGLILLLGGMRVVSKSTLAGAAAASNAAPKA